jgi:hypothetical protein
MGKVVHDLKASDLKGALESIQGES